MALKLCGISCCSLAEQAVSECVTLAKLAAVVMSDAWAARQDGS
jgi:hypothetical protein